MGIKWEVGVVHVRFARRDNDSVEDGFVGVFNKVLHDREHFATIDEAKAFVEQRAAEWLESRGLAHKTPWRHYCDHEPTEGEHVVIYSDKGVLHSAVVEGDMWYVSVVEGSFAWEDFPFWCYVHEISLPRTERRHAVLVTHPVGRGEVQLDGTNPVILPDGTSRVEIEVDPSAAGGTIDVEMEVSDE